MKKYLKILIIFALSFLVSMQTFGQGMEWDDDWGWDDWWDPPWDPYDDWDDDYPDYCWCQGPCTCGLGGGTGGYTLPKCPNGKIELLNIMTYNIEKRNYRENGFIMATGRTDVVAVQEIHGVSNFETLTQRAGMDGHFYPIINNWFWKFGIGLLWKSHLGTPKITRNKFYTPDDTYDSERGYIIAEFCDFIIVVSHFPAGEKNNNAEKKKMTEKILGESIIQNTNKPVFIAADFNFSPHSSNLLNPFTTDGFNVLNDTTRYFNANENKWYYYHTTTDDGRMPDMIMLKQNSLNYEIMWRGIPENAKPVHTYSDHLPYVVKLKLIE